MRRSRVAVLLIFLVIALLTRACILRPASGFAGSHFNSGRNGAWLDIVWVNEPHSPSEIADLAARLRRLQIRTVYAYVSYLNNGAFNATYAQASDFTRALKAAYPAVEVQAWLGLPLDRGVDLSDAAVRRQIGDFSSRLVREQGFSGVHLDPEPVANGDHALLQLLDEVRAAFPPGARLSIAAPKVQPFWPDTPVPGLDQHVWRAAYLHEVAQHVDQVAVMSYDSGLPLAPLYRHLQRFEVIAATQALADLSTELLIGVPTSEEATATHWPAAENMASGLQGIIDGLNDLEAQPQALTGVAVYPDWETDDHEWVTYEQLWLGRSDP